MKLTYITEIAMILVSLSVIFSFFFLTSRTFAVYFLRRNKSNATMKQLENLIAQSKGKFFSITFVKKDGSIRTVNGKDKYLRLLRGGDNKVKQAGYLSAVNRNKEQWFSFKPDSVVTFKCGNVKKTFAVSV